MVWLERVEVYKGYGPSSDWESCPQGQKSHRGIILHREQSLLSSSTPALEEGLSWLPGQSLIFLLQVFTILSIGCTSMNSLSLSLPDKDVLYSCNLLKPVLQSHQRPYVSTAFLRIGALKANDVHSVGRTLFFIGSLVPRGWRVYENVTDAQSIQRWLISMTQWVTLNLALLQAPGLLPSPNGLRWNSVNTSSTTSKKKNRSQQQSLQKHCCLKVSYKCLLYFYF